MVHFIRRIEQNEPNNLTLQALIFLETGELCCQNLQDKTSILKQLPKKEKRKSEFILSR